MNLMRLTIRLLSLLVTTIALFVEAGLWVLHLARELGAIAGDFAKARTTMRGGELYCPRGHVIPLDGEVYECSSCGFVWEGSSMLRCPNVECQARATAIVFCPTCRLSRRNPYRWGNP